MPDRSDSSHRHYNPDPHARPGLHAIAVVEAVTGTLAIVAATDLDLVGPASLRQWLQSLIERFRPDPGHGTFAWLLHRINPDSLHLAAAAVFAYGLRHLVEARGLWRARTWASWLGCLAAGGLSAVRIARADDASRWVVAHGAVDQPDRDPGVGVQPHETP